jgi:diguanylate cyclase (GGDEF)-like protein
MIPKHFFFIVNTHTNQNAIVSFNATSKTHFEILQNNYAAIESAFFLVSPIVQSRLLKKNFIQSQSIDSVTNVYNRQYLTKHVNKLISLSGKSYDKIYFLMIGVDRLKAVIDEFDYDMGDKVLIELARVIHSNIHAGDLVARLTGDEFLVSIVSHTQDYEIEDISQKIITDFAKVEIPITIESDQVLKKTICIGFDTFEMSGAASIDDIIKNADIALYEAKNEGRSMYKNFQKRSEEDNLEFF